MLTVRSSIDPHAYWQKYGFAYTSGFTPLGTATIDISQIVLSQINRTPLRLQRQDKNGKKLESKTAWTRVNLVEPRGIEPLSESNLERTSPGAVCYLHSL